MTDHGPSWRYNDGRTELTVAEIRSLDVLASGLVRDDPRLAQRLSRFGARGRLARAVAATVFVLVSATMMIGLAMITPILVIAFGAPVCLLVGVTVCRVFDGPRARRRRA